MRLPVALAACWLAVNAHVLLQDGQTLGKRLLGIRIVTLAGERPSLGVLFVRRYLAWLAIGYLPYVGVTLTLADIALIFIDNRCLHDYFAGTRVVRRPPALPIPKPS